MEKITVYERKICVRKYCNAVMTNKSRPKRYVQHVAYLRPIKDALLFLAATQ